MAHLHSASKSGSSLRQEQDQVCESNEHGAQPSSLRGSGPHVLPEPRRCGYKYTGLGLPRAGSRKWIHTGIFTLG